MLDGLMTIRDGDDMDTVKERAVKDIWIMAFLREVKGIEPRGREVKRRGGVQRVQAVWFFEETAELKAAVREYYDTYLDKVRHRIRSELERMENEV